MLIENDFFNEQYDIHKLISSYNRFVPFQMLKLLGKKSIIDVELGDHIEKNITVLFTDIRDFTTLSESLTPQENFNFINSFLSQMEPLISAQNGVIDKFIGDAIMAIFPHSANDALDCSLLMLKQLNIYNEGRMRAGYKPINIGIGLNTGLSILGTVGGVNRMEGTVISDAVNLASRLESTTKKYAVKLLISENTFHNLDNIERYKIRFIDRILVKGKNRPQSIYEIYNNDEKGISEKKDETKAVFEEALACYHYKKIDRSIQLLEECLKKNPEDMPARIYLKRCKTFEMGTIHEGARELSSQITWSPDFEIGHELIDKQHYELYKNSITLIESVNHTEDNNEIKQTLDFLGKYVIEHFNTEEELMEKIDYPFINHQKKQHANFIHSFQILKKEIEELKVSKTYLMFRIQIFLIDWLVNHTMKEDKHLGKYLNSRFPNTKWS